jgi:mono/diheme cytochrome c family protein
VIRSLLLSLLCSFVLLTASAPIALAQDPAQFFRQNCASCHTVGGGRITGPDLEGVTARKDRQWLVRFILNPKAVIDSGDPYAKQLLDEARGVIMPSLPGMNPALAEALLDLIEAESKLEHSQFAGLQLSDRPFGPADVQRGHDLFTGEQRLATGGPPCLSCHSVGGVGALGGGKLGPDLTLVYERLNGRRGLGTWLAGPATPTMQTVFRDTPLAPGELDPLLAFFEDAARRRTEADPVAPLTFFLLGLGGAIVGAFAFDLAWLHRFRSVRARLVEAVTGRTIR